jgi:hypothetical protein
MLVTANNTLLKMAADGDDEAKIRKDIGNLTLRIASLEKQIATIQDTATRLKNRKNLLEISITPVNYETETKVSNNALVSTHAADNRHGAPRKYDNWIYEFEGLRLIAVKQNIAINKDVKDMVNILET